MIPIVTPTEMRAIDAAAPEPVEVLIGRAGAATARAAIRLLGGTYGRRVLVVAGKGNNGNDGRAAAAILRRAGVRCEVIAPEGRAGPLAADLVVDAAFGTGFRGSWRPPPVGDAPVLAVDIPSGVDGTTGSVPQDGEVLAARATVTFAALKPGLLLGAGRQLAGTVAVADIGLDASSATAWLIERGDVAGWLPERAPDTHKWRSACLVVAGSPGMAGASQLATRAAYRTGAGYVRLATPGADPARQPAPTEVVAVALPATGWAGDVLADAGRFAAAVVGPGLGRGEATDAEIRRLVSELPVPVVVDGDALSALGDQVADVVRRRSAETVLTPHDGEFARLTGSPPSADRLAVTRHLAARAGAVVLLKGPATVVAAPDGRVLVAAQGDARLATAGTGDVLSGIIGALAAQGVGAWRAAAMGAWIHGEAARHGPDRGLVAGDLVDLLPAVWGRG